MEDELGIYGTSYQEGQGVLKNKVCVLMPSLFLYEFTFMKLVQSICIVCILFLIASVFLLPHRIQDTFPHN
jgi:hypothetical protein